jgi:hypothetical protein
MSLIPPKALVVVDAGLGTIIDDKGMFWHEAHAVRGSRVRNGGLISLKRNRVLKARWAIIQAKQDVTSLRA